MPASPSNCAFGLTLVCSSLFAAAGTFRSKSRDASGAVNAKSVSLTNIPLWISMVSYVSQCHHIPIFLTVLWVSRDAVATSVSVSNMLDVLSGPAGSDNPIFINFKANSLNVLVGFHFHSLYTITASLGYH